jgi:chromosome partitioning protein
MASDPPKPPPPRRLILPAWQKAREQREKALEKPGFVPSRLEAVSSANDTRAQIRSRRREMAHVIIVGNEKGGAGKSTLSIHIAVALRVAGLTVAAIDLDRRQRTFARYFDNRRRFADAHDAELVSPQFHELEPTLATDRAAAEREEIQKTQALIASLAEKVDVVLVDSPGADTAASRAAHAMADTILTPMNDSFVDFDLLANVDPVTGEVQSPSIYSQMVFDARKQKALSQRRPIDWIVVRNRLSALEARNKRRMSEALQTLAVRIGFRVAPGLNERVIYREMFPSGLTLLDLTEEGAEGSFTMSHVAARQELRELISVLRLPVLANAEAGF